MLKTADYDYSLPPKLIAQAPLARRDDSRLMVVHRATGAIEHRLFRDIAELVAPGDLLVRNVTRVFRARLLGTRDSGAPAEVFLLKPLGNDRWEAMVQPGGKLHPPRVVHIAPGFDAQIVEITDRRTRIVQLKAAGPVAAAIEEHGHVPLPPYIERSDAAADVERYQTVYASHSGSVAAPTAGLHFTPELLASIQRRGAQLADLTLHVGAGTFKPVDAEDISGHQMHEEWFNVPAATAAAANATRAAGKAIWAVGTTSLRTLESSLAADGTIRAGTGETRIFLHPPQKIRGADRLITNFHLPRSTLLMLVAAFAGYDLMRAAYDAAVRERYRFYSYGDAMVIQ
jgi:S-adenosylmethionine:tRNA ribosyltransferase-isomerase